LHTHTNNNDNDGNDNNTACASVYVSETANCLRTMTSSNAGWLHSGAYSHAGAGQS